MKPLTIFDSSSIKEGSVALGIVSGVVLNLLQVALMALLYDQFSSDRVADSILFVGLAAAGLVQLIYIVPLYLYLRRKGKPETAKGVVIAASLGILINGLCWGAFGLGR